MQSVHGMFPVVLRVRKLQEDESGLLFPVLFKREPRDTYPWHHYSSKGCQPSPQRPPGWVVYLGSGNGGKPPAGTAGNATVAGRTAVAGPAAPG